MYNREFENKTSGVHTSSCKPTKKCVIKMKERRLTLPRKIFVDFIRPYQKTDFANLNFWIIDSIATLKYYPCIPNGLLGHLSPLPSIPHPRSTGLKLVHTLKCLKQHEIQPSANQLRIWKFNRLLSLLVIIRANRLQAESVLMN